VKDDGSELRYVRGATHDGGVTAKKLAENECTIFRGHGPGEGPWMLRFCFRRVTDGKLESRAIPVYPNADQQSGGWGLKRVDGGWQVAPSIACSNREPDGDFQDDRSKDKVTEVWHQTPLLVEVPDGEPWQ